MPTTVKKRMPAEQRRQQILQCAIRVFARSNYQSTRIADIAQAAGVSEAMIYKHFPRKKAIFMAALDLLADGLSAFWENELNKETQALSLLKNMVVEYHRLTKKHPDEVKLQFIALAEVNDAEIRAQLQRSHRIIRDFIRKILEKGVSQGVIQPEVNLDALTYLNLGGGALTHIMTLLASENEYSEDIALAAVDHLIASIKA